LPNDGQGLNLNTVNSARPPARIHSPLTEAGFKRVGITEIIADDHWRGLVAARYDVFLSFKNLGPDGKRTRDSVLADDIYQYLLERNLSVFLSTVELEAQGASAYKEVIDEALDTSRVLIAIGTLGRRLFELAIAEFTPRFESERTLTGASILRDRCRHESRPGSRPGFVSR
jgi:hypothetical protein